MERLLDIDGVRPAGSKKTFSSFRPFHVTGQAPYRAAGAGHKSLLVLFFRKEHASCLFPDNMERPRAIP
jgi:hypothetical protein